MVSSRARALVDAFERGVDPRARRSRGVHYTPAPLAELLVARAMEQLDGVPRAVCDPSCGSGAFLLAAADELQRRGVPAAEVVTERLVGIEIDPAAAASARATLVAWAADHGAEVAAHELRIDCGDALATPGGPGSVPRHAGIDVVIGNPPFLNQLDGRTARGADQRAAADRLLGRSSGYADGASLFLLAALDLLDDRGGVVCLLQPHSFLAARDVAPVRAALLERARLAELWGSDESLFDAEVRVCAPVLVVPPDGTTASPHRTPAVRVLWGLPASEHDATPAAIDDRSWGPLLAGPRGIPTVPMATGGRLGDVATATAGFRDEYYALTDCLLDDAVDEVAPGDHDLLGDREVARLATVGMIDLAQLSWGRGARRVRGAMRLAPSVDLAALAAHSPKVATWARARLVPKVLVATQTRIVESVADPHGHYVPVTPTISVEPLPDAPSLDHLVAALSAPSVAASAAARHLGAGLSAGALRWSARSVLEVALPVDVAPWDRGAEIAARLTRASAAQRPSLLDELGATMTAAHGLDADHPTLGWWRSFVR